MLSREDRILSELIVSRGLATPEAVERRARQLEDSNEKGLVRALVSHGELDPDTGRSVHAEAQEIDGLLRADLPQDKRLGDFRLLREIGRGGMGIVYEAEQESLGRRVALKLLPAGAALDERLAIRFLREARTAARLRHPGIVPVFGSGSEQGVLFFAMELVEGESLAARIERGPIPAREAAGIACEIARALEHAHDAGLIHRDVKPENVMIGADGRARLADFGLVHDLQGARLTRSQYVLGTPAYSAPEQARGEPVDPRSDIYGVGAVLYAMLSGQPPFTGEVPAAVLGRLARESPAPLARMAPETPAGLIAICNRAMARDPEQRYPDAGSLAQAIVDYLDQGDAQPAAVHARRHSGVGILAALVAAAALTAAVWVFGFRDGTVEPEVTPAATGRAGLLRGTHQLFPTAPGIKSGIALSPDGLTLAYYTGPLPTDVQIYVHELGQSTPTPLVPGETSRTNVMPTWSPDGARIAYCRSEILTIVEVATGSMESLDLPCRGKMSWSLDGTRMVHEERVWPATRLRVVDLASRSSRLISAPGTRHPSWNASDRIAFVALRDGQYDIWTSRDDGSEPRRVTEDAAWETYPLWSARGDRLYYASKTGESHDLWEVQVDGETGERLSEPAPVTRGWFGTAFSLTGARVRDRLAFVQDVNLMQTWVLPIDSGSAGHGPPHPFKIDLPFEARLPERAPDRDAWIVSAKRGKSENLSLLGHETETWITDGPYRDEWPRWSPDGRSVAFHSDRSGSSQIWTVNIDGTGLSQLTRVDGDARCPVWAPDGTKLAYHVVDQGPWSVDLETGNTAALPVEAGFQSFEPWSWSRDRSRLAGTASGIAVLDMDSGTYERVSEFGERPLWIADSGELVFVHGSSIYHWNGRGEPRTIWSTGPNELLPGLSLGMGAREVYFRQESLRERIWLIDLDDSLTE